MRRLVSRIGTAALVLACAAGCGGRTPLKPSAYRGVDQGVLLAWAWGGAPGFEDDDPSDVHVLFGREPGDADHRLLSCHPRESACRALNDFQESNARPKADEGDFVATFATGSSRQDRMFVVVAVRGDRLVTSDVIVATASSRPTVFSAGELRFDRTAQQLVWPRVPDNDLYVLTIADQSSERALTTIATRRKSWTYPELQGIVQHFHDPERIPELRPSGRYVAVLYSLNKQRWATIVSSAAIKP